MKKIIYLVFVFLFMISIFSAYGLQQYKVIGTFGGKCEVENYYWGPWSEIWCFNYTRNDFNFSINISNGWNMISIPWQESISKQDLVVINGSTYSWTQAVGAGLLINFIYGWDTSSQFYFDVNTLEPGKGYWLWSYCNGEIKG